METQIFYIFYLNIFLIRNVHFTRQSIVVFMIIVTTTRFFNSRRSSLKKVSVGSFLLNLNNYLLGSQGSSFGHNDNFLLNFSPWFADLCKTTVSVQINLSLKWIDVSEFYNALWHLKHIVTASELQACIRFQRLFRSWVYALHLIVINLLKPLHQKACS